MTGKLTERQADVLRVVEANEAITARSIGEDHLLIGRLSALSALAGLERKGFVEPAVGVLTSRHHAPGYRITSEGREALTALDRSV